MFDLIEELYLFLLVAFVIGLIVGWRKSDADKTSLNAKR